MAGKIRVFDSTNRTMQRLGYLKLLCFLVNETETTNLASLGKRLIDRVTKRFQLSMPLDDQIKNYVKNRLTDSTYRGLRKTIMEGTNDTPVSLEIQDIYLADSKLPSRTGKLVKANWRRYPYLGTSIDLIKKGTYSALTRSILLLAVTPSAEIKAFFELDEGHNPLKLSDSQVIVLLYCLIDNDAEVVLPLFRTLSELSENSFNERVAGDLLPDIFRKINRTHQQRSITVEERERLALLMKSSNSVENRKGKAYTGGSAREETVRVRLEPYCDLGFLSKPDRDRYEYQLTGALHIFLQSWKQAESTDFFLKEGFFHSVAACKKLDVRIASDAEATEALVEAWETLKSLLGYSPITDVGLLAGIRLLTEKKLILELSQTTELLKKLQKQDPYFVRFTVDRMGIMAHVKFLKSSPGENS